MPTTTTTITTNLIKSSIPLYHHLRRLPVTPPLFSPSYPKSVNSLPRCRCGRPWNLSIHANYDRPPRPPPEWQPPLQNPDRPYSPGELPEIERPPPEFEPPPPAPDYPSPPKPEIPDPRPSPPDVPVAPPEFDPPKPPDVAPPPPPEVVPQPPII